MLVGPSISAEFSQSNEANNEGESKECKQLKPVSASADSSQPCKVGGPASIADSRDLSKHMAVSASDGRADLNDHSDLVNCRNCASS